MANTNTNTDTMVPSLTTSLTLLGLLLGMLFRLSLLASNLIITLHSPGCSGSVGAFSVFSNLWTFQSSLMGIAFITCFRNLLSSTLRLVTPAAAVTTTEDDNALRQLPDYYWADSFLIGAPLGVASAWIAFDLIKIESSPLGFGRIVWLVVCALGTVGWQRQTLRGGAHQANHLREILCSASLMGMLVGKLVVDTSMGVQYLLQHQGDGSSCGGDKDELQLDLHKIHPLWSIMPNACIAGVGLLLYSLARNLLVCTTAAENQAKFLHSIDHALLSATFLGFVVCWILTSCVAKRDVLGAAQMLYLVVALLVYTRKPKLEDTPCQQDAGNKGEEPLLAAITV